MEANFVEFYKTTNRKNAEELALDYLVTDTLQKKLRGPNKSKQFTAMDMESYAPDDFIPTMFYTFMYSSPTDENEVNIQFKDRVPLILCTSHENRYITGINFNLIPCDSRAYLLDLIVSSNPDFYKQTIINAIPEHKFVINELFARTLIDPAKRKQLFDLFDNLTGLKISRCYRTYRKEFITNVRLIEYDMWKYIPFLAFKDAVRGVPLATLQAKLVNDSIAE